MDFLCRCTWLANLLVVAALLRMVLYDLLLFNVNIFLRSLDRHLAALFAMAYVEKLLGMELDLFKVLEELDNLLTHVRCCLKLVKLGFPVLEVMLQHNYVMYYCGCWAATSRPSSRWRTWTYCWAWGSTSS